MEYWVPELKPELIVVYNQLGAKVNYQVRRTSL